MYYNEQMTITTIVLVVIFSNTKYISAFNETHVIILFLINK